MAITMWRPVNPELKGERLTWCKRHDIGMSEEIARTDAVLAEAKRQVLAEVERSLVAMRQRLEREQEYCGIAQVMMWDVAQAVGLNREQTLHVTGKADELYLCLRGVA